MELTDLRDVPEGSSLSADICVVGSGPAGMTLARELSGSGADVILLESGGLVRDSWADALNTVDSIGSPRALDQAAVQNRVLGGSSATWSGRVATFDDLDFSPRDWLAHTGWPISRAELQPYFVRSMTHLGQRVPDNNAPDVTRRAEEVFPGLDETIFRAYAWSQSADDEQPWEPARFGGRALRDPLPGIRGYLDATATHIDTDPQGREVRRVEVRARDGGPRWVVAPSVVLCAGAIENARLLLASNRIVPGGVGNRHDRVGRFLMDHLRGPVGYFSRRDLLSAQRAFGGIRVKIGGQATLLCPGLSLSPETQAREGLLSCALWMSGRIAPDDPVTAVRNVVRTRRPGRDLLNVVRHPLLLAESAKRTMLDGRAALARMSELALLCMVEQSPDPESRITLSRRTDALGVPVPLVDWRVGEREARTVRYAALRFVDEMRRLGLPAPDLLPMVTDPDAPLTFPDVAHPTGTTRMSRDPRDGVVDPDGRVHGVEGLYVAGSSVFPTSSHANPTQMIVALAIRLADHLKCRVALAPSGR